MEGNAIMRAMNLLRKFLHNKYTLILFLICAAIWFSLWVFHISIIPLDSYGAPDEGLRYLIPKFIFENGRLPTGYDAATIHTMGNWSYAFYPQFLGPLVSTFFMSLVSLFVSTPESLIYGARMGSVLFGVLAVLFVGRSVEKLFKGDKNAVVYSFIAMILFVAWPQVAFLSAYVNNDIVALSGVAIIVYASIAGYKDQWNMKNASILVIGIVICLLGYINSYGFVLFGGLFFLVSLWWQKDTKKYYFKLVGIVALITIALAGPFFIRNAVIYNGDVLGMSSFREETLEWETKQHKEAQRSYSELTGKGIASLINDEGYSKTQISSTIARFGKMTIAPEDKYMNVYKVMVITGLVGCFWMVIDKIFRHTRKPRKLIGSLRGSRQALLLIAGVAMASLVTVGLSLYYSIAIDYQAQGRYVIYLLIPLIIISVYGFVYLFKKVIVSKYQSVFTLLLILYYLLTTLTIFYKYVYAINAAHLG